MQVFNSYSLASGVIVTIHGLDTEDGNDGHVEDYNQEEDGYQPHQGNVSQVALAVVDRTKDSIASTFGLREPFVDLKLEEEEEKNNNNNYGLITQG